MHALVQLLDLCAASSSYRIGIPDLKESTRVSSQLRKTIGTVPTLLVCRLLLLCGCTYRQAYLDAGQIRASAADFYNDEIMDNLIRAYNHKIFVHVDLDTMQPTVATKISAMIGGGQTLNDTSTRQTTAGGSLAKGVVQIMTTATELCPSD